MRNTPPRRPARSPAATSRPDAAPGRRAGAASGRKPGTRSDPGARTPQRRSPRVAEDARSPGSRPQARQPLDPKRSSGGRAGPDRQADPGTRTSQRRSPRATEHARSHSSRPQARQSLEPKRSPGGRASPDRRSDPGPTGVRLVSVDEHAQGQRLDNFLMRHLKGVPKSHIYRLVRKGEVRVNKGRVKPDSRLDAGDVVRIPPVSLDAPAADDAPLPEGLAQRLEQSVLLEDEDWLIIDKPAGLPVHGGSGVALGVIEAFRRLRPYAPFLELGHRLDRETSGVLVLAKSRRALLGLHDCLRQGRVEKTYQTLLAGPWRGGRRVVQASLLRDADAGSAKVRVDEEGRDADSVFTPLHSHADASLMEVRIGTGRTHQIRVHAAHIGHPVAGDRQYGDFAFNRRMQTLGLHRLFLHACSLSFTLPDSGRSIHANAPLAPELQAVLSALESR